MNFAQQIKQQFEKECREPFPLEDVTKLGAYDPKNLSLFHAKLETYLSYIAGYASSADRLQRRARAELIEAKKQLSHTFFEEFRPLAGYQRFITPEHTHRLFRELAIADKLRKELIIVIDGILSHSNSQE